MASSADELTTPGPREIARLLAAFPGRASIVTRIALICALTVLVTSAYGIPEASTAVYIVLFLNRPDRVTSVITCIALMLLVTVIIGIVMVFAIFCINDPVLRVASMAVLSMGFLFATSASKLRPVGAIVAMIVGFGLDELGLAPLGEAATRGLLYAWLFVAVPIGVAIVVNLLFAPSPRRLACAQLARRLRLAAACLTGTAGEAGQAAFEACVREGDHQIMAWVKLSKLEGTSTEADCAALRQAAASSTAILVAVDLAMREPRARLPAAYAARLAETMEQMAVMLDAGGYPENVAVGIPEGAALEVGAPMPLPPLAALVLADLRAALEGFAQPASAAAARAGADEGSAVSSSAPAPSMSSAPASASAHPEHAPARSGFFDADAFSNPDHIRYALKTTAAAMFCYVLYQQLDWQGIHTSFITCYMVSLGTTAETVEKLLLRIIGCLIGALLGTAALVYVVPQLTSIAGLMALVFAGSWLAAWVAVGSPRIAYAGMQIAFAFYLCVIQGGCSQVRPDARTRPRDWHSDRQCRGVSDVHTGLAREYRRLDRCCAQQAHCAVGTDCARCGCRHAPYDGRRGARAVRRLAPESGPDSLRAIVGASRARVDREPQARARGAWCAGGTACSRDGPCRPARRCAPARSGRAARDGRARAGRRHPSQRKYASGRANASTNNSTRANAAY